MRHQLTRKQRIALWWKHRDEIEKAMFVINGWLAIMVTIVAVGIN